MMDKKMNKQRLNEQHPEIAEELKLFTSIATSEPTTISSESVTKMLLTLAPGVKSIQSGAQTSFDLVSLRKAPVAFSLTVKRIQTVLDTIELSSIFSRTSRQSK